MDDSFLVRELRRVGDLSSDLPGVIERHWAFRRLTLDQFYAQCMIVNAVNMGDVRMVQGSEQLGMQSRMQ